MKTFFRVGLVVVAFTSALAEGRALPSKSRLYQTPDQVLDVVIEADFSKINTPTQSIPETAAQLGVKGMLDPKYFESTGTLSYQDGGRTLTLKGLFYPRGKNRRISCDWKPLEFELEKSALPGTIFEGGKKQQKLVTHCWNTTPEKIERGLRDEFLAHRVQQALGAPSFLVRWARVTYLDSAGKLPPTTQSAFFLENKDDMAERYGGKDLELTPSEKEVPPTDAEKTNHYIDWYRGSYGDYIAQKYILRGRVSRKYDGIAALQGLRLDHAFGWALDRFIAGTSRDFHLEIFSNIDAIVFPDGSATRVHHDLDGAYVEAPPRIALYPFFLLREMIGDAEISKLKARPIGERKDAVSQITRLLSETAASVRSSGIFSLIHPHEALYWPAGNRPSERLLEHLKRIDEILADPERHFAFLL